MITLKTLRPTFRKLSELSVELLSVGKNDFMAEVQHMAVRLREIEEQLLINEDK